MALDSMVTALRTDLADPNSERFSDTVLQRCILKSVFPVNRDLGLSMVIASGGITPEPQGETLGLLLLQAQIAACQFMRAATANAFSFSSGDKKIDKTAQPEHWEKLEADLSAAYRARVKVLFSGSSPSGDDSILVAPVFIPVIYEQGVDLIEC